MVRLFYLCLVDLTEVVSFWYKEANSSCLIQILFATFV